MKIHKKVYNKTDVYTETLERIRYIYSLYSDVIVSFSGGKDSTALLHCTIEVARELGRLPVKAIFFDEEAIHPPTIEYVERVRHNPDVDLQWFCLPIKHRNACSNEQPWWYPWKLEEKDLWVRPLPENVITEHPAFEPEMSFVEFCYAMVKNTNACVLQGIRAQESMRRQRVVSMKKNENYLVSPQKGCYSGFPIYDWSSTDVWKLVTKLGIDYNRTYDIFNKTDMYGKFLTQRVCPPFGEEPLRGLHIYATCFPEMWHKMIYRVKGAATAARYGNTQLYSSAKERPEGVTWQEYIDAILGTFEPLDRALVQKQIESAKTQHFKKTNDPIPEDESHPLSGCSYKFLASIAIRGDFKGRTLGKMIGYGEAERKKKKQTLEEAQEKYGKN